MWTDCTTCFESCASTASECGCLSGAGEAGLPLLFIMALIVLGLFTVIGIFYSVLVATMVGQRIWQRHYHILAKRMLTKVSCDYEATFFPSLCDVIKKIATLWCINFLASTEPLTIVFFQGFGLFSFSRM